MVRVIHCKDGQAGTSLFRDRETALWFVKEYASCIGNQVNDEYEEAEWHSVATEVDTALRAGSQRYRYRFDFPDESYMVVA